MNHLSRRNFLALSAGFLGLAFKKDERIQTVSGAIRQSELGVTLIHEHFLVDFIGADSITSSRWNRSEVVAKVLPYLLEARRQGVKSMLDCTPAYLGRDVILLEMLSRESGLQILTNTGYYGAVQNRYLPAWAFTESALQLSKRWIKEYRHGIDGTHVRPGFIKIAVDGDVPLSAMHRKLVEAAARTHLETGLTICSHTGLGLGKLAFEQMDIIEKAGAHASSFVWVHAQGEPDKAYYEWVAERGAWVSLDGVAWGDLTKYTEWLVQLKKRNLLHRVLLSHDAGWYKPMEPDGIYKGYTTVFTDLIPKLRLEGFSQYDIDQLLVRNPAEAFCIRKRKRR